MTPKRQPISYASFVQENYSRVAKDNPAMDAKAIIEFIARQYNEQRLSQPAPAAAAAAKKTTGKTTGKNVDEEGRGRLVDELAAHRDRWQALTGRSEDLDADLSRLTTEELHHHLMKYRSAEARDQFYEMFDRHVDWRSYYRDHDFLRQQPLLRTRTTRNYPLAQYLLACPAAGTDPECRDIASFSRAAAKRIMDATPGIKPNDATRRITAEWASKCGDSTKKNAPRVSR